MAALTRAQVADLAERLRSLLASIERGEFDATTAMRYRLEGALTALEVALGERSSLLGDLAD